MAEPDRGVSRTAEYVALFRALESRLPADRRLFEDPYAQAFLGAPLRTVLAGARVPLTGRLVDDVIHRGWPGAMTAVVVRTRYIDAALVEALDDGVEQVVILGSGFDTRAYRLRGLEAARVFEVDAPATLAVKRARIEERMGGIPGHVAMVAVDFERDDLGAALAAAGFRARERAFVIWEGVTDYLSAVSVSATLRDLAGITASGSRIVFTYLDVAMIEGRADDRAARATAAAVRRAGEPFRSGLEPAELSAYLAERGFGLLEDHTAAELAARYLHPLGRRPPASDLFHIALAAR